MNILIADDKQENRYLIETILKHAGYEVAVVANGAEALEKLRSEPFDMIISDILMPVMDGFQLCREVKSNNELSSMPFIFYTATYVEEDDEKLALAMGADMYLRKPMEPEAFVETLRQLMHDMAKRRPKSPENVHPAESDDTFKLYNERLIHKLEQKVRELEHEIAERKKIDQSISYRINLERIITKISAMFINIEPENVDDYINHSLELLGVFFDIDRCYIFQFSDNGKVMNNIHEWCHEDIEPQIDELQGLSVDMFPWWMKKLNNIEPIQIPRVTDLPEEANSEKKILESQNIQSLLVVPMEINERLFGYIGFDMVRNEKEWSGEDVKILEIVADIFANAFERMKLVENLRDSEMRYRVTFDTTGSAIAVIEDDTTISMVNNEFARISGFSKEEIEGKLKWTEIVASRDLEKMLLYHRLRRENKESAPQNYEFQYINAHGELRDAILLIAMIPHTTKSVASFMDITERKKAEELRLRLETAIEQLHDIIIIADKDSKIQYVNNAFKKITGYSADEVIGKNPRFLQSGQHDVRFYENLWKTITHGKSWNGHFINKKKDGSLYHEDATITSVLDDNGKITNYIAVKRDVTDKLGMEQRLRKIQKMEAVGTLAGGIAHDFNNILSSIIGFTELAMGQVDENTKLYSDLDRIYKSGYRAKILVDQLLTFSRQQETEAKPIQLSPIVKESLKFLRSSFPTNIEIQQHIENNLPSITADPAQIHQLLINLCTNADSAMREKGGVLGVTLSSVEIGSENVTDLPNLAPGTYLHMQVSDSGYGIDKKNIDRIFDPYFTTKDKSGGGGLGLAVVHGIVEGYGGTIAVQSKVGKGTIVDVYLPASNIKEEPEYVDIIEVAKKGGECILFIDDEQDLLEIGRRMLEKMGYEVVAKDSSVEALELFQQNPSQFDAVITDMTMPFIMGDELIREILSLRHDIPIIICTGYNEKIDEQKALELGARAYIKKPFTTSGLISAVRRVLDQ